VAIGTRKRGTMGKRLDGALGPSETITAALSAAKKRRSAAAAVSADVKLASLLFDVVLDAICELGGQFSDTRRVLAGDRRRKPKVDGAPPNTLEITSELAELGLSRAVKKALDAGKWDELKEHLPPPGKRLDSIIAHLLGAVRAYPGEAYGERKKREGNDQESSRIRTTKWVGEVHNAARLFLDVPLRPGSLEREVQKLGRRSAPPPRLRVLE
jgi:hypothetical protein